jgi:photosynthetic reaction center H subunit
MLKGLTAHIDVAQVALYMFWIFFAGLIFYLHRENKREGYPLEEEFAGRNPVQGFPAVPTPKVYLLPEGGTQTAPRSEKDSRPLNGAPSARWPGSPLVPTGDPLLGGLGPAAWAERADITDKTNDGRNRLAPMRQATEFHVDGRDPDPRGMAVYGADGAIGGTVSDVWVDLSEHLIRYLEVDVGAGSGKAGEAGSTVSVLLPINFARIDRRRRRVDVTAICAGHFASVPQLRSPGEVTRREEDRICAYYGGGTLYATPERAEPLL